MMRPMWSDFQCVCGWRPSAAKANHDGIVAHIGTHYQPLAGNPLTTEVSSTSAASPAQEKPDVAETEPRLNKCIACKQDITSCAGEVCDLCADQFRLTPIEFAPLDGTPLLLFSDDFGKHLLGYGRYMRFDDGSEGWIASSFHCYNGDVWTVMSRPTHFMRLPQNPVGCASVSNERSESSGITPERSAEDGGSLT